MSAAQAMDVRERLQDYVARGFYMFPCEKQGKRPAVRWTKFIETPAAQDVDALMKWVDSGYNLAVALKKSGYVALDLDSYKVNDGERVITLPDTGLVQQTPRGGRHYLYQPNGSRHLIRDIQTPEHVDVKYHGYVLLEPSQVTYSDGSSGGYSWVQYDRPALLPDEIIKRWFSPQTASPSAPTVSLKDLLTAPQDDPLDVTVNVIRDGFSDGQHNNELLRVSKALYRVMASDNEQLKADMVARIMLALDQRDPTPQGEQQTLETVRSAIQYESQRISRSGKRGNTNSQVGVIDDTFEAMDFAAFAQAYDGYQINYLIPDYLPESAILMVSAPPESYKTWLLMDAALSLSLNVPFLGIQPTLGEQVYRYGNIDYGVPTMLIQQEDFAGLQFQRLHTIMKAKWGDRYKVVFPKQGDWFNMVLEVPDYAPIYIHTRRQLSLDRPDSFHKLERQVQRLGIRYVMVDPFYSLSNDTEKYFASAAAKFGLIRDIRDNYGCGFLIAHHSKKDTSASKRKRDNFLGSQLLGGATEGIWTMTPVAPHEVELYISGKFYSNPVDNVLKFSIDTDAETYNVSVEESAASLSGASQALFALIQDADDGITATVLADETGVHKGTVYKNLKELEATGWIVKTGKKYYAADALNLGF